MAEAWDRACEPVRVALELSRDPGTVLQALRDDRMPFALVGDWAGGGAIVGSEPLAVLRERDVLNPPQPRSEHAPSGFVGGGWVGHFGFGLASAIERLPPPPRRPQPLPRGHLAFYDHVLHLDAAGHWWLEALWPVALERALRRVRHRLARQPSRRAWCLSPMRAVAPGESGHRAAVAACVERIASGELFQANICLRLEGSFEGSGADAFAAGIERLRPPRAAFVSLPEGALLSFSPELFLRRRGTDVETAPIKGTNPRDRHPGMAEEGRRALGSSAKDAAEHVMIVDLMRNDLGRVARYGTVAADPQPRIEPHPGVWHMVTSVRAQLRPEVTDGDLLRATFPPGSVTGAPKVQALKVISELEASAREAYTGAIGIMSPIAGLELNVAIRTLEVSGGRAWLGCGGGIVAGSEPERELSEAFDKAGPIVAALGSSIERREPGGQRAARAGASRVGAVRAPALGRRPDPDLGLYETMRVIAGEAIDLDAHLARLARALESSYGARLCPSLREQLCAAAATAGDRARLRVVVAPGADPLIQTAPVAELPAAVSLSPVIVPGGLGDRKLADRVPLTKLEGPGRGGLICDLDGCVLEASSANLWAVLEGELVTPPADGRILPGITRGALLELGGIGTLPTVERPLTLDRLRAAEAIIVSSSVRVAAPAGLLEPGSGLPAQPSELAVRLAAGIRSALGAPSVSVPGVQPPVGDAGSAAPAADCRRPAQTALAPRSPTLKTM